VSNFFSILYVISQGIAPCNEEQLQTICLLSALPWIFANLLKAAQSGNDQCFVIQRRILMNLCPSVCSINELSILEDANEELLVAAARSGEHAAFSGLWSRYSKKAFSTIYRITKNREDAEDALQEAFLKAFVHLNKFDGRSTFSTWLTRIAINSALMILRKKRTHPETSMDWSPDGETWQQWEMADRRANIEEHFLREEAEQQLKRAIGRLQPALRTVIEIQQLHDTSVKELAGIAGISVAATKSRLLRARGVLRRSLR
jgi:RNA polymerase sigma factor (sigma-70 family)